MHVSSIQAPTLVERLRGSFQVSATGTSQSPSPRSPERTVCRPKSARRVALVERATSPNPVCQLRCHTVRLAVPDGEDHPRREALAEGPRARRRLQAMRPSRQHAQAEPSAKLHTYSPTRTSTHQDILGPRHGPELCMPFVEKKTDNCAPHKHESPLVKHPEWAELPWRQILRRCTDRNAPASPLAVPTWARARHAT